MAEWYLPLKHFHLLTVVLTALMFILRFCWLLRGSPLLQQRWVRIIPHLNDTLLLLSGVLLVTVTHFYPFSPQGSWLTEKLFGVIIYIALGFIALGKRPRAQKVRWIAFIVALAALVAIVRIATTKMPLLGFV
ncbi:siroheme synthase [Erwinia sp. E602]|uniref:SirB2 family protein n=1 Tax=unclassified Erwinia TaxID=2622719 RepID=UPI0006FE9DF9|nr:MULTISPECIES: SirB2 family protein [unclassified Erwinia]KQN61798.1 siroheme synthase [Erwinia sp. Leaf53]PLV49794.1 siroheme synthase [Erwinia sp. B116]QUG75372.1 siroheme synthase [Erwinia sp. E602]